MGFQVAWLGLADGLVARRDIVTLQQLVAVALTQQKHNPASPRARLHQGGGGGREEGVQVGGQRGTRQRLTDGLWLASQQHLHAAPQHGPPRRLL